VPRRADPRPDPDLLEIAADRAALAAILEAQGRHGEARDTLREVLTVVERVLGPDHYQVAVTLERLAGIARSTGDPAQAAPLYTRALAIKRRVLGAGDPGVVATRLALETCREETRSRNGRPG
jgi:hypothetical protein